MKKTITLLSLFVSLCIIAHAQTNCSGSATAAVQYACVGDTIQLTGFASSAGNGLDLNGINEWVEIPQNINPGSDLTISLWMKSTQSLPNRGDMVTCLGPGASGFSVNMNASTPKKVGFWVGDVVGGYVFSNTSVNDGNWHHITCTYNSATNEAKIYIDGALDITATRIGNLNADTTTKIGDCGGFGCPGYEYEGNLDEVRIWNTVRSLSEIQTDMNKVIDPNSAGLLAYYRFDEGTGTSTADLTGNGYDGTLTSTGAWDVPSMAPIYPDIVYWSPSTDISDTSSLNPVVYPSSYPATYYLNYTDLTTGCTGSASTTIEEFNPQVTSTEDFVQCLPISIPLEAGPGGVSYLWNTGSATTSITANSNGYYYATVTSQTGCVKTTDSILVRGVWVRTLGPRYCNRYDYLLSDKISTRKGIGDEDFNWEFVDTSNVNDTIYHTSPDRAFVLSDVNPPLQPGKVYSVRVRLVIDGEFECFGNACEVGLAAPDPGLNTTKLKFRYCNNLIDFDNRIKAKKLTDTSGTMFADAYEFSLYSDAGCTNLFARVLRSNASGILMFSHVPGLQSNTTYWVLVRGKVNGSFSNFGDTCSFTTPVSLTTNTTRLRDQNCDKAVNPTYPWVICNVAQQIVSPFATADAYAFSIYTDSLCTNLLDSVFKNNTTRRLQMANISGLQPSTKYWVLCYGRINGEFTPLDKGDTCFFISPATLRSGTISSSESMVIDAYPNPFDNGVNLSFTSNDFENYAVLNVYDLSGRLVYENDKLKPGSIDAFGELFDPGMYVAIIRQGEDKAIYKIVKSK